MRELVFEFDKLSPCGSFVGITMKTIFIPPYLVKISFWQKDFLIGSIHCAIGDQNIFKATDQLFDKYFVSAEFKQSRKEEGRWN